MHVHSAHNTRATKVIVIGGSAGAIQSLKVIVRALPPSLKAALCVVVHVSPDNPSYLPAILTDAGPLPAKHVAVQEPLHDQRIYVAPPNRHLLLGHGSVQAVFGAKENRHRPAIDALFRSAAAAFGDQVLAVLLSGYLDDGTAGLAAVQAAGGRVIIQDPVDTDYPDMLRNALAYIEPDRILPVSAMAEALTAFARRREPVVPVGAAAAAAEAPMANVASGDQTSAMPALGEPSLFSCPECNGTLWQIDDGKMVRFRCHEGHAYSPLSLLAGQEEAGEAAMWIALRSLDEKVALNEMLAHRAQKLTLRTAFTRYQREAKLAKSSADFIRSLLAKASEERSRAAEDDE